VDEDQRAVEARVLQVLVVGAHLVGQEHALVDDRARRQGDGVESLVGLAGRLGIDAARDHLAQDVETPLVVLVGLDRGIAADEDLPVHGFGGRDVRRLGQRRIVDRHVAEAEQRQAFGLRRLGDDVLDMGALGRVARHEQVPHRVMADGRQVDALRGHLLAEEAVRNLHEHARAVSHQRVGADGAAMRQVLEHGQAILDDLVRADVLHVGDEADAAGIVLLARIVEAARRGQPGMDAFDRTRVKLGGRAKLRRRRWRDVRHRLSS
jgi:hypothetical protein